jgi:hypothetical protein
MRFDQPDGTASKEQLSGLSLLPPQVLFDHKLPVGIGTRKCARLKTLSVTIRKKRLAAWGLYLCCIVIMIP